MKMHCRLLLLCLCFMSGSIWASDRHDFTQYVDPFVGTQGTGHTFPGAVVPFGMVAPSPDTADRGWSYSGGYQHSDPEVWGFSNTHISGAGIPELGDLLMQPRWGRDWNENTQRFAQTKDPKSERARPGFYQVKLPGGKVTVSLSASQRVAWHEYRFERSGPVQVLIDAQHGLHFLMGDLPADRQPERVLMVEDHQVDLEKGLWQATIHSSNWVKRQASVVVQFDAPIQRVIDLPARTGDLAPRQILEFNIRHRVLVARVALSTVDKEGAMLNLKSDPHTKFSQVAHSANQLWNNLLSRIEIDASSLQKKIFYTALYHALIHPSDIGDADGRVRGPQGQIIRFSGGHYYSTFSLWDTFRAVHPLLTLIAPERVDGIINSMLLHHEQQGYLPLWTVWGRETSTMIGNPALPVISDAMLKGFRGFDHQIAYRAMLETSTLSRPHAAPWAQKDWSLMDRYGYLPFDLEKDESVSKTLEYGYGDDAVAQVAGLMSDASAFQRFSRRAKGWMLLWDEKTLVMRGKDSLGNWRVPFDPDEPTSPLNNPGDYTEANAWQYSLTPALHDPQGLLNLMGGEKAFEQWLDLYFSRNAKGENKHLGQEALIGQNAHGNEPSHHSAWLYAYTFSPWKGHALVRQIAQTFYQPGPAGLVGNDDCGQMSAWYVFATLGFYPVTPGQAKYVLGLPMVARAKIKFGEGQYLTLMSEGLHRRLPFKPHQVIVRFGDGRIAKMKEMKHQDLIKAKKIIFSVKTSFND